MKVFNSLQTTSLLDGVSLKSLNPMSWSKYDDRISIILKSGIYTLSLNAVPSNMCPALNTSPHFIPNSEKEEIVDSDWLPDNQLITLTNQGSLTVTNLATNQITFKSEDQIYTFCYEENALFMADFNKGLSLWCGNEKVCKIILDENIGEIKPFQAGNITLLFLSLSNGTVRVARCDKDGKSLKILEDIIWSDEDFIPANSLKIIKNDFSQTRTCTFTFTKNCFLIISQLDLSHPSLETLKVINQRHLQICPTKLISYETMDFSPGELLMAPETGPILTVNIPPDFDQEIVIEPTNIASEKITRSTVSMKVSKNGLFWILLQDGPMQDPKGRLQIFSEFDLPKICQMEKLWIDSQSRLDLLELIRMSILQDPVQDITCLETILSNEIMNDRLKYWISVFLTLSHKDLKDIQSKFIQIAENSAKDLLIENAMNILQETPKIEFNQSLKCFLSTCGKVPDKINYIPNCKLCSAQINEERTSYDLFHCQNDHSWPRCSKSMQICDTFSLSQCSWCGATALSEFARQKCTLCPGLLKS